jgi:uncharacterized delta-60 repeat protein
MNYRNFKIKKKNSLWLSVLIVGSILFPIPSASAADGDLDTTFDTDGIVTTRTGIGHIYQFVRSIALQSDGKIVATGYSEISGNGYDFAIVRYNANGTLDTTFGGGDGIVTTDFGNSDNAALSMALQSDGKIVVAGYSLNPGTNFDIAVGRYNADGTPDTSFGTGGLVMTDFGSTNQAAVSVVLQSNGKIVVAGYSTNPGNDLDFAIVRYNADGTLDTTFGGGDGIVTTDFSTSSDYASSIALQSDGKIVVAGNATISGHSDFAVARYNGNGTPDTSFSGDGKVTTNLSPTSSDASSLALQSDGKIVVAGGTSITGPYDFSLVRYNADGTPDTSFGTDGNGIVITELSVGYDYAIAMTLQNDGKIVATGVSNISGVQNVALLRYNANGTLDTSFSGDGIVTTQIGNLDSFASAIALQSDGKIVAAGSVSISNNYDFEFAVVRYLASGSTAPADPTLNSVTAGDRRVTVSFTAGANNGAAITDYEYSLNGGAYTSAGTTTSPFTITGLSGRTAYSVTIKARNSAGLSIASSALSATTTDASRDVSEAAAEAARVAAANAEAARVAAANAEAARKAKEQKELTEILAIIPKIVELTLGLGETTKSLYSTKCVKGKTTKYVKYGAKCPKGY